MANMVYQSSIPFRIAIFACASLFILFGCNSEGSSGSTDNISANAKTELRTIEITDASLRWYEDNNLGVAGEVPLDFHSRMATTEDWYQTLKIMDVFYLRSTSYQKYLSTNPAFTKELASLFSQHNISLAIDETAATWAHSGINNRNTLFTESLDMLDDLTNAGFNLRYISLQSVLSKPIKNSDGNIVDYPFEKRYLDVSSYITKVSELYPSMEFGIIDALPAKTTQLEYEFVYRGLFEHLTANNLHLDYLHLDLPINLISQNGNNITTNTVKHVNKFVTEAFNWRFGWIVTDRSGGNSNAASFAHNVSQGLNAYLNIGGEADDYILSAWFPYPQFTVPDEYHSTMPAFSTFRMMDQILNVAGNGNSKQCTFEITGEVDKHQSLRYVNYQTLQEAPVIYRLYCNPEQSITLADGTMAKATKATYQCTHSQSGTLYFSDLSSCDEPTRIGYLFPQPLPGTKPLYLCPLTDGSVNVECSKALTNRSDEPIGYY